MKRILVIGDSSRDIFVYCDAQRLCRDVPVPVLNVKDQDEINRKLAEVRSMYKIQLGQDPNKKDKYGKELINISFVK